jgi:hypothetical protein
LPVPIFIDVLEPIYFERSGPEAADDATYVEECHQRVLDAMQLTLDQLMQERRLILREQLRAVLPRRLRPQRTRTASANDVVAGTSEAHRENVDNSPRLGRF